MKNDTIIIKCFECESTEHIHQHHVVPESLGGKKTLPLCEFCHGKIHDRDFTKWRSLVTAGYKRARENGVKVGRKVGYKKTTEMFMNETKIKKATELLSKGMCAVEISKLIGVNKNTLTKLRKIIKENKETLIKD